MSKRKGYLIKRTWNAMSEVVECTNEILREDPDDAIAKIIRDTVIKLNDSIMILSEPNVEKDEMEKRLREMFSIKEEETPEPMAEPFVLMPELKTVN